jgi:hypothetical protein
VVWDTVTVREVVFDDLENDGVGDSLLVFSREPDSCVGDHDGVDDLARVGEAVNVSVPDTSFEKVSVQIKVAEKVRSSERLPVRDCDVEMDAEVVGLPIVLVSEVVGVPEMLIESVTVRDKSADMVVVRDGVKDLDKISVLVVVNELVKVSARV